MEHFYSLSETVVGTLLTVALKQENKTWKHLQPQWNSSGNASYCSTETREQNVEHFYSLSETEVGRFLTVALKQENKTWNTFTASVKQ